MKLSNALRLYRVRLRARFLQECFAVLGIAAGVALLFASQVSSSSLQGSVAQLSRAVVGKANLQLVARDSHGFPESMLAKVRNIPGVRVAAPVLEANANAVGPHARESIELVGADSALSALRGTLLAHANLSPFGNIGAVALPAPLAKAIGVTKFGQEVSLQIAGRTVNAPLYEQLHERQIGALVATPLAIAPLAYAQEIAGMSGRVSRILVQSASGAQTKVRAALTRTCRQSPECREHQLRRDAVREGGDRQQPVHSFVLCHQRACGLSLCVQRDVADRTAATAAGR